MDRPSAQRPFIVVSHSRADARWAALLKPRLEALPGGVVFWDDGRIDAGGRWYADLERLLEQTSVSLCLMSPDYLESAFGTREEFLHLLERRSYQGMAIVPLLLRPCDWRAAFGLTRTRVWPEDGGYVADAGPQWPERLAGFVAGLPGATPEIAPPPPPAASPKVDLSRLPVTGWELFGRRRQLALLDDAWDTQINVVCLVASGGVGKSTVVNRWPEHLKADGYRGARRVYAWSFYSQGSAEQMTSADAFMVEALAWFGDPHPDLGAPWDKGERLTELIRRERTLLILDGLEPLQSPQGGDRGRIRDPALATLVTGLARRNPGLCVITSREPVTDLADFPDAVRQVDLEQIPLAAGRALLRVNGIRGSDAELEDLVRAFGRHALTLRLLAAYLNDAGQNRAAVAAGLPDLDIAEAAGRHFRRVIAAFERHLGEGPEVEALRLLGLFDRPADAAALAALRAPPAIPGL
nr:toll/interleukin-1 receptor domain-containing protein [Pseudomonadota bacterium]